MLTAIPMSPDPLNLPYGYGGSLRATPCRCFHAMRLYTCHRPATLAACWHRCVLHPLRAKASCRLVRVRWLQGIVVSPAPFSLRRRLCICSFTWGCCSNSRLPWLGCRATSTTHGYSPARLPPVPIASSAAFLRAPAPLPATTEPGNLLYLGYRQDTGLVIPHPSPAPGGAQYSPHLPHQGRRVLPLPPCLEQIKG